MDPHMEIFKNKDWKFSISLILLMNLGSITVNTKITISSLVESVDFKNKDIKNVEEKKTNWKN